MWGYRIVVPYKIQNCLLNELHSTYIGMVKKKSRARSYFWWPGIDKAIENMCKSCNIYLTFRPEPEKNCGKRQNIRLKEYILTFWG